MLHHPEKMLLRVPAACDVFVASFIFQDFSSGLMARV
jgi:hypothetical protein